MCKECEEYLKAVSKTGALFTNGITCPEERMFMTIRPGGFMTIHKMKDLK